MKMKTSDFNKIKKGIAKGLIKVTHKNGFESKWILTIWLSESSFRREDFTKGQLKFLETVSVKVF